MNPSIDHYLSEFEARKNLLAGSSDHWVLGMREQAIQQFCQDGFPTRRHEEWKYTDLTEMSEQLFQPLISPDKTESEISSKPRQSGSEAVTVRFENGRWLSTEAGLDLPPPGVMITSLGKMLTDFPDRIKQHLALFMNPTDHALVALNTAFAQDGAFVLVEKGVVLDRPLHLIFRSSGQSSPHLSVPRNLIILEEGAQATIQESYIGENRSSVYWTNAHTEILLGRNSQLEHVQLQDESRAAFHTALTRVKQDRDSRYLSHVFSLGGLLSRNDLDISLEDSRTECELNGLYIADDQQHIDHHTRIDHIEPDCTSREHYKGILTDRARAVFNGKVYVHPDAQRTAAYQSNPNLLLSRSAEIDTKPQLEIFADDVKCSHGATIGQLDDEALYFLRSRGIDRDQARNMLLSAFAGELVDRVSHNELRQALSELIKGKLAKITGSRETS